MRKVVALAIVVGLASAAVSPCVGTSVAADEKEEAAPKADEAKAEEPTEEGDTKAEKTEGEEGEKKTEEAGGDD